MKTFNRIATEDDLKAIVDIYNSTIASREVTADTEPVTVEERRNWFLNHSDKRPLYVKTDDNGTIYGWLSFETFYGRPAYNGTVEISIYLNQDYRGQGIGSLFLKEALELAPSLNIRTLLAFIFGHNKASIQLFKKYGFKQWGYLPQVAKMDGNKYDLAILGKEL
ncbi:N-acetyltransferase family protein [Bacillus sp. NPDC077027]|uniref:GNAT family N-acetyltransferase n=1 Tax=Bacillus sp. NPDC077027 TaxID=3390548 RepID=UPI003D01B5AF